MGLFNSKKVIITEKKGIESETFQRLQNDLPVDYINRSLSSNIQMAYKSNIYVWLACQHISGSIRQPMWRVYKSGNGGKVDQVVADPFDNIIGKPNTYQTYSELIESIAILRRLSGIVYLWIYRDKLGGVQELHVLNKEIVSVIIDKDSGLVKKYMIRAKKIEIDPKDIITFKYYDPSNLNEGYAPVNVGALQIDSARNVDLWNNHVFENGAIPSFVVEVEGKLVDGGVRLRESIQSLFSGVRKAGKALVLDGGAKAKPLATNHKDMSFPELKKMSREDIGNLMMIPMPLLSIDFAKYDNFRESMRVLWAINIIPELVMIAEGVNRGCFEKSGRMVWFDLSGIEALKDSENEKFDRILKAVEKDLITLVDAGNILGLPVNDAIDNVTLTQHRNNFVAVIDTVKRNNVMEKKNVNDLRDINIDMIGDMMGEAVEEMKDEFEDLYKSIVVASGKRWVESLKKTAQYNPMNESIAEYAKTVMGKRISGIDTTIRMMIREQIGIGMAESESMSEIAGRIMDVFEGVKVGRAYTIARTETHNATQFGVVDAYEQSGMVEFKEWITERDDLVRDEHDEIDGQQVGVKEMFIVAGRYPTYYPGNTGVARLDINCRCGAGAVFFGNEDEKGLTPEMKYAEWKAQDNLARSFEGKVMDLYLRLFTRQQKKIREYLNG